MRTTPVLLLTHEVIAPPLPRPASATAASMTTRTRANANRPAQVLPFEVDRPSRPSTIEPQAPFRKTGSPDPDTFLSACAGVVFSADRHRILPGYCDPPMRPTVG